MTATHSKVAVMTKYSEIRRKAMQNHPAIQRHLYLFAVLIATSVNVIESQKPFVAFTATRALPAVVVKNLLSESIILSAAIVFSYPYFSLPFIMGGIRSLSLFVSHAMPSSATPSATVFTLAKGGRRDSSTQSTQPLRCSFDNYGIGKRWH